MVECQLPKLNVAGSIPVSRSTFFLKKHHFHSLTQALNDRLKPRSRKGAGFVLDMLNTSKACGRADRGLYGLQ